MTKDIVFVSYTVGRDGATRVMTLIMNEYAQKGWNVTFVVRDVYQKIDIDPRIKVVQLGKENGFSKYFFVKWLRKFIATEKPQVAVSFW